MYYSLADAEFWLYGAMSFVALIVSCYFPGWLLINRLNLRSKFTETALSCVVGIVLWAYQGYVLGYVNFRYGSYFYLAITLFLTWKYRKNIFSSITQTWNEVRKIKKIIILAIITSVFFQLYSHVGSGLQSNNGVAFYFVNSVDGVMHLSYIQSLTAHFPPIEPGFSGKYLENYHYWGDLVLAEFARVWKLPVIHLFFQYFPIYLIVLTTALVIQLVRSLKGSTATILVVLFLLTFGADAAFVFSQYLNGNWGNSIAALDTGVSFIFNMPQVFSRVVLVAVLILFLEWLKKKQSLTAFIIAVLGASLFGFKVYYGMYLVIGFGFFTLYLLFKELPHSIKAKHSLFSSLQKVVSNNKTVLFSWILLAVLSTVIFLPNNSSTGGLFLEPLAWPKKFLSADNFNYQDWFLRMQVYEDTNNVKNIFFYNTLAILITILSVFGIRSIGIFPLGKSLKDLPQEFLALTIPTNIIFVSIGFLFLQTTGGFNIYNFLITPVLLFNIILAFNITSIKNNFLKLFLILLVVACSLPRSVLQLTTYAERYTSQQPDHVISYPELELLNHFKTLEPGVIQADIANTYENSTPYVSFFSNQQTYLGGKFLLKMDYKAIEEREKTLTSLFNSSTDIETATKMKDLGITYLYITSPEYIEKYMQLMINSTVLVINKQNEAGIIISTL